MNIREIRSEDNLALADIIRDNLEKHELNIPGTVYFDDNLNRLSEFYLDKPEQRKYYILLDENERIIGGIGLAEFEALDGWAELQKLYLIDEYKGQGLGKKLVELVIDIAQILGYSTLYLETHTNLKAAIGLYEKCGFKIIDKPDGVVHSTMNRFYVKELS